MKTAIVWSLIFVVACSLCFTKAAFAEWHTVVTNGNTQSCYSFPNGTVVCS